MNSKKYYKKPKTDSKLIKENTEKYSKQIKQLNHIINDDDYYTNDGYFDFIKNIGKIMEDDAIIVFNVNKQPFNYEHQLAWKKRREEFYGTVNTGNLSIEFLLNFYKELFLNLNLITDFCDFVPRHLPHLDYFVFNLRKIRKGTACN